MTAQHTPGPWKHRNGRIFQLDREELTIANVARAFDGDYSQTNGDLIAAAPDLLEALRAEEEWRAREKDGAIDPEWDYETMVGAKRRAAIAKATGQ